MKERHGNPQDHPEVVVYFILASLFLWLGTAMWFLGEGGYQPRPGELAATFLIGLFFILLALLLTSESPGCFVCPRRSNHEGVAFD